MREPYTHTRSVHSILLRNPRTITSKSLPVWSASVRVQLGHRGSLLRSGPRDSDAAMPRRRSVRPPSPLPPILDDNAVRTARQRKRSYAEDDDDSDIDADGTNVSILNSSREDSAAISGPAAPPSPSSSPGIAARNPTDRPRRRKTESSPSGVPAESRLRALRLPIGVLEDQPISAPAAPTVPKASINHKGAYFGHRCALLPS